MRVSVYPPDMDSGSEPKRVVIRASQDPPTADQPPPPPEEREPDRAPRQGAQVDVWLALSILGSILAAFGPLLPWWRVRTLRAGIRVATVTGTGVWLGIVAFVGGITALATCTYLYTRPDRRGTLGLLVLGGGIVAFMGSALAILNRSHFVVTIFRVDNQIGIFMALAGGLIAAFGGYLLAREGSATEGSMR